LEKQQFIKKLKLSSESFIPTNWLGTIFFIGLGLLYFLFTFLSNIFFGSNQWKNHFILDFRWVEVYLLFRFILFSIFKLFKLQKGIDYNQASAIIGNHFRKWVISWLTFYNYQIWMRHKIKLLLAASIEKSQCVATNSFGNAINYNSNRNIFLWL
jgi:hypothetical protein